MGGISISELWGCRDGPYGVYLLLPACVEWSWWNLEESLEALSGIGPSIIPFLKADYREKVHRS
ncbi:hypothetical protein EYZ11_006748 [Aspergillus tanneri]|uniref:Uncharacterized protein n=1 Tax=Aspergillus tanneri TaxID=1220188 RepID=A0A4S3JKD8_9EURO|nr:hypothetical protein EYZ11_006748 [Aspergillus tanneri]